jgi:hypothetical protein
VQAPAGPPKAEQPGSTPGLGANVTEFHYEHGVRWVRDPRHGWIAPPRRRPC